MALPALVTGAPAALLTALQLSGLAPVPPPVPAPAAAPPPAVAPAPATTVPATTLPAAPVPATTVPAVPVPATAVPAADRPAALVAAEDERLALVRRLLLEVPVPFRVAIGSSRTLVLTARPAPYTVADLRQLAPQTLVEQGAGTYLLSEHVAVAPGATLQLSRTGGLQLRLASGPAGFVSLTGLGGHVVLAGATGAPVSITSWDVGGGGPDRELGDGRAYVRVLGGQLETRHVLATSLGFWSGRTGGIAVTGSDASPDAPAAAPAQPATVAPAGPPAPGLPAPPRRARVDAGLGPSRIDSTVVDGDAYGLFVSGAAGLLVTDSTVRRSLVAGVVLHRDVTGGGIRRTSSTDNAGDGFRIDRSTSDVTLTDVSASRNAANGITIGGRPLADGPSATGAPTRSSGRNAVVGGTAEQNGRYGIEVDGGDDVRVQGSTVSGGDMGIVVSGPATGVVVSGSTVTGARRHGIAVLDGVRSSSVRGCTVERTGDGVYVRASSTAVTGNTVRAARHGVSFVGDVGGSELGDNTLTGTGRGTAAVERTRSTGTVTTTANDIAGWDDTTSLRHLAGLLLHPMNALWFLLALLLSVSALRSRIRPSSGVAHPYAHQMAHHGVLALPDHAGPARPARPGSSAGDTESRDHDRTGVATP